MIIKCPQCATSYNIPEEKMGPKARKMRCSRCKTVFTIARRGASLPPGYEEFAGSSQSALPNEFAFLRQSPPKKEPAVTVESERKERRYEETILGVHQPRESKPPEIQQIARTTSENTNPGVPIKEIVRPEPAPEPLEESVVDKVLREAREKKAASISAPPAAQAEPEPIPQSAPEEPVSKPEPTPPEVSKTPAPQPAAQPSAPQETADTVMATPSKGVPVPDIYGAPAQAWETEDPLELDEFAVETSSGTAQAIGKFMTVVIVVIVGFFVFVAYRNGWSLSYDEIGKQVSFAFSLADTEKPPKEAQSIETTVDERRTLLRKGGKPLLVVTGKVFNNSPLYRTHIILRGRLLDAKGEMRAQTRFPCDKIIEDSKLKKAADGTIPEFFKKGGELYDCAIAGESNTFYQLIFEDVPIDYDDSFKIEVEPIYASAKEL